MHTNQSFETCTCTDPAVACPSCIAKRDRNGWPKNWQERMGSTHAPMTADESGVGA